LSFYDLGQADGSENVTLLAGQMPAHTHGLVGDGGVSGSGTPAGSEFFGVTKGAKPGAVNVYGPAANTAAMDSSALSAVGGSQPHNNRQPYLGVLFIIAMQGIFPARN
jgi:microcystin-dependent protein